MKAINGQKHCPRCQNTFAATLENFYEAKGSLDHLMGYCKPCARAHARDYNKAHPGMWQKFRWGLTLEQYNGRLCIQGGGCAICGKKPGAKRRLDVDHDEKTGKFRGILCNQCNQAIGLLGDDPARLKKAIEYLTDPWGNEAPGHE